MGFASKEIPPTVSLTHHLQESVRHAKKSSAWTFSKDALQFAQLQQIQKNMLESTTNVFRWTFDAFMPIKTATVQYAKRDFTRTKAFATEFLKKLKLQPANKPPLKLFL
jgi:hypothetical protein